MEVKKIKGINKFVYRGYEVYDEDEEKTMNENEIVAKDETIEVTAEKPITTLLGSRTILDSVVYSNRSSNPNLFSAARQDFRNAGLVNRKKINHRLSSLESKTDHHFIDKFVNIYTYLKLKDDECFINYEDYGLRIRVNVEVAKFIKAGVTAQYGTSLEYSFILVKFINKVLDEIRDAYTNQTAITLPICVSKEELDGLIKHEVFANILLDELNVFFENVLKIGEVPYNTSITSKKVKEVKAKNSLIDAAEIVDGE